eukprot:TRINITY_DN26407_c0_g1_i1.p1 TRINITY_DN26407_c0_g1~~TRINITY_DN26407_c0_g1_i1.p1  ORF type:complete len:202 (-),score=71.48 TRINITY_DN26407_c0_g1_i1:182-787(-)
MPQEFQALRCFKCETFQVSQVKKSSKWVCKICQEKQTTKHVYSGGSGAECRKVVQELNWKRMELSNAREEELVEQENVSEVEVQEVLSNEKYDTEDIDECQQPSGGRWAAFLPPPTNYRREVEVEAPRDNTDTDYSNDQPPTKKAKTDRIPLISKQGQWGRETQVKNSSGAQKKKNPVPAPAPQFPPVQSKWSKFVSPSGQ